MITVDVVDVVLHYISLFMSSCIISLSRTERTTYKYIKNYTAVIFDLFVCNSLAPFSHFYNRFLCFKCLTFHLLTLMLWLVGILIFVLFHTVSFQLPRFFLYMSSHPQCGL